MYDARLALYDLDTLVDLLPLAQDFDAAIPLNDDSTISFTLPAIDTVDGVGVASITEVYQYLYNYDIALQVSKDGSWVEPPNCRFYLMDDDVDPSAVDGIKFNGVLAGGFDLSGIVNLDPSVFIGHDLTRQFTDATPGVYMVTMLQDAQAQGLGTALSWDFTTTHDSSGVAWPLAVSMELKQNATAHNVLLSLTLQGLCDWRFEGNVLRMFSPDGSMHMVKPAVELMLGREVTSGPQKRSVAEMVDKVIVLGDEGYTLLRSRPSSRKRGPRAVVQSQGGVTQEATAILFADNVLDKGSQIRGELTRDISLHDECLYLPFFDYGVGDEVMAPGTAGMLEPLRVFQITLSKGGDESLVSGNALFGDRFLEFLTKQSRRINGILGGSTISGGTNATPVPPPEVDLRTPAAPTGLVGDSSAFFDTDGNVHAQAFLEWLPVTTADDGSALEVMAYDVYVREDVPGSPWVTLTTTSIPAAAWQPFAVGSSWRFHVRAIGKYTITPGVASDDVVVTMVTDATPPGVPSVPVVTSGLGVVRATWDGLVVSGGLPVAPPIDFNRTEIAIGTSASPVVVAGSLGTAGTVGVVADPGTTQYARARAIDRSGNASAWSASASIVVTSVLDDPDLAGAILDGSIVVPGAVDSTKLATAINAAIANAQTTANTGVTNAATADAKAVTATADAATAQTQADTATTNAATADAKAVTATADAATAASAAATADAKAVTASGLASTKAVVLYQTAAPGSTYQNVNTLWIDTTGGANTPKMWVSGTTWAAVTDKAATDAASAAATANTAASTAQTQANTATTNAATADAKAVTATADAATADAKAVAAQATANAATATANGKNKVIFSTSTASGTAYAAGDIWFQESGAIIIGQWEFVAGAWAARTIDNAVIANIDAGKITTGSLAAQRIAAGTITSTMIATDTIVAGNIAAGAVAASELAANSVIAGKIAADAVTANTILANAVTAGKIATDAVTANTIVAGAVVADKIAAGAVIADKIQAGSVTADKIAANAIDVTKLTVGIGASLDLTGSALAGDVSILNGTVADITSAVIIDSNGVTITNRNPANPHQVTISNSRLSFFANGAEVAYVDSEYRKMFITQVEVTDNLKVGVHQIQKYDADTTLVRWVG